MLDYHPDDKSGFAQLFASYSLYKRCYGNHNCYQGVGTNVTGVLLGESLFEDSIDTETFSNWG